MATKTIYDYNTGKPLQAGQAQSLYNTKTGQKIGVPASTNPIANQSTTTLSTANAQNKVVGIKNQIATNNQNGLKTTTGADGNSVSTYADNSVYTPPEAPQPVLSGQGGYYGDQYVPPNTETPTDAKGKPVNLTTYSPAQQQGIDDLNRIRTQANANSAALIGQIQNQYTDLIAQQNLANNSANAGATAYTIGGGRGVASGDAVVQQTVSYGIQKVKELVDAENMAIVQANTAATNNDWQMASKINDNIAAIKDAQQKAITKINDDILAAKKELKVQQDKIISDINEIAKSAKANGADTATVNAILNSKDVGSAINASGSYLQTGTGVLGDWLQYKRNAEAKGLVPLDYMTFKDKQDAAASKLKASEAYSSAYNSAAGKAAAETKYGTGAGAEKPANQSQFTAAGFANRVVQAKELIDSNTSALSKLGAKYLMEKNLPNFMQSDLVQKELQAERNFVNAVLRRESGAAISPEEFKSAEKQYFPQPGDSQVVLGQKKANRDLTAQNLINESGTAYKTDPIIQEQKANDDKVTTGLKNIQSTNPALYKTVSEMYTSVNPTTGQPYSAEEILQAFPELNN